MHGHESAGIGSKKNTLDGRPGMLYVDRPASHPPERENFRSVREMYSDDGYTVLRTSLKIGRALGVMLSFAGPLLAFGCSKDSASTSVAFTPDVPVAFVANPILRVYHNPYALVDWATSERLLAQHHDHFDTLRSIVAYDNAGYDVISYMNYSGLASASYSWRERRWPVSSWLPADFEKGLRHLKLFIPDGEEVGYQHVTSSFMTRYIAKNEAGYAQPPGTIMYGGANLSNTEGTQTEIDAINIAGGFPIISHPWTGWSEYQKLEGYKGVEIYNAYVAWKAEDGSDPYFVPDRNFVMQGIWDQLLMRVQTIIGIAVIDHFGPNNNDKNLSYR
ncbi:MAG: hypothetical protein JWM95_2534, partial [Gemmatimonadetes bacterium]|nr:hypothetical protein [Gemmatimonadota bacterium]